MRSSRYFPRARVSLSVSQKPRPTECDSEIDLEDNIVIRSACLQRHRSDGTTHRFKRRKLGATATFEIIISTNIV